MIKTKIVEIESRFLPSRDQGLIGQIVDYFADDDNYYGWLDVFMLDLMRKNEAIAFGLDLLNGSDEVCCDIWEMEKDFVCTKVSLCELITAEVENGLYKPRSEMQYEEVAGMISPLDKIIEACSAAKKMIQDTLNSVDRNSSEWIS